MDKLKGGKKRDLGINYKDEYPHYSYLSDY
jgi:hypothetical protein